MKYLFPKPVEIVDIKLSDTEIHSLIERAYQLKTEDSFEKSHGWWCNTWSSLHTEGKVFKNDNIDSVINKLKHKLAEKVTDYINELGINNPDWPLYEKDFWFNIAKPGDYQEIHNHATPTDASSISAVYYLQVPKDSGDLVVFDQEFFHGSSRIPNKQESYTISPAVNRFVIFTSDLPHLVSQNLSQEDRISIAINYEFRRNE